MYQRSIQINGRRRNENNEYFPIVNIDYWPLEVLTRIRFVRDKEGILKLSERLKESLILSSCFILLTFSRGLNLLRCNKVLAASIICV
jgi:hypothetical protein